MRHSRRYDFQGHPRSGSRSGDDLSPLSGLFLCTQVKIVFAVGLYRCWLLSKPVDLLVWASWEVRVTPVIHLVSTTPEFSSPRYEHHSLGVNFCLLLVELTHSTFLKRGVNYCDRSVCLSVFPLAYLRNNAANLHQFLCMFTAAVAWTSSDGIAKRYILQFLLWYFHITRCVRKFVCMPVYFLL